MKKSSLQWIVAILTLMFFDVSMAAESRLNYQAQIKLNVEKAQAKMYSKNQFARQPIIEMKGQSNWQKAELKFAQKARGPQNLFEKLSRRIQKFFLSLKSFFRNIFSFSPVSNKSIKGAPSLTWYLTKRYNADVPLVDFRIIPSDPDNDIVRLEVDFGDGTIVEFNDEEITSTIFLDHVYPQNDHFNAKFEVEDSLGNISNYMTYTELEDSAAQKVVFTATPNISNPLQVAFAFTNLNPSYSPYIGVCPSGSFSVPSFNCTFPSAGTYPLDLFYIDPSKNVVEFSTEITVGGSTVTAKPVAYADMDKVSGPAPLTVNFDSEKSFDIDGQIVSYSWNFGDEYHGRNFAKTARATHTFSRPGLYFVNLTVKDNDGLENTYYREIHVENPATPDPKILAFNNGGLAVSFETSNFGLDTSVRPEMMFWDFGDGNKFQGSFPYHVYASAGTYTVHLKAIDIFGHTYNIDHDIVLTTTNESPIAVANTNKYKAIPYEDITYSATGSNDPWSSDPLTYKWAFVDEGVEDADGTILKSYVDLGIKSATLYVTNSKGFSAKSFAQNEVLSSLDVFNVVAQWNPKVGIGSTLVNFDGSKSKSKQGKIVSYQWNINGQPIIFGAKGSHTFTTAGNNYFDFVLTDAVGNQTSLYDRVIINSSSAPGNIAPVASLSHSAIDSNGKVFFNCASSTDADGEVAFCDWKLNGIPLGMTKYGETYIKEPIDNILELTVTDNNGATDTKYAHIDLREHSDGYFGFDFSPLTPVINQEVTFGAEQVASGAEITSYAWDFGDSTTASGQFVKHTYTSAGNYTIALTFTDEYSNTFSTYRNITVGSGATANTNGVYLVLRPHDLVGSIYDGDVYRSFNETETVRFDAVSFAAGEGILHDTVWYFGDGKMGYGESVEYNYLKPGTYLGAGVTRTKSGVALIGYFTIIINENKSCVRTSGNTMCVRFPAGVNSIMPLSAASWTLTHNQLDDFSSSSGDRPKGWIKLVNADDKDQTPAIDISDAVTSVSGKDVTISREKILEKNVDLSKPYMVSINTKSSTGSALIGDTLRFYFGGSRLNINIGETGSKLEVVHSASMYREFFDLPSSSNQVLTDMPSGDYVVVATKGDKKLIQTIKVAVKENKPIAVDLNSATYFKKKKAKKKLFTLAKAEKDNGDENQPSWTHSLCGEPSPFKTAEKKNLNTNEYFSHVFTSADPTAEIDFKAFTPDTPRPITLSCGVTTPALLYGQNKWKYKDGPARCDGDMKPHGYWKEYLKNLHREESPIVIVYEITDEWTHETIKGHYITSAKEIQLKNEMRLSDLTSKVGLGTNDDQDWSQRIEYLLPVPVHFRRPQVRFELISENSVSSEDFYSVECHVIEQKTKPQIARLEAYSINTTAVHDRVNNGRLSLEKQYNYFPLQYDGRGTSAESVASDAAKVRYKISINHHNFEWIQWQQVEVVFMYGDQSYTKVYDLEGLIESHIFDRYKTDSFTIDTADLENHFQYIPGEKKMYLKVTPIGKNSVDYDFRGESKKFPFTPLFDLQTVAADYPMICPEGFYGSKVTTFVRDELIESLIHGSNANAELRCGDASAPFGGIFELNSSTWVYNDHRDGTSINVRSLNESGTHDSYDDFSGGTPARKGDIYEYLTFSAGAKTISEITSETELRTPTAKKKLYDFCHPGSGEPIAPCTEETEFTDLDHDMILQICQWNMSAGVMPDGCPSVDTSKIIRFANWVGKNASAYSSWARKFPLAMMISAGRKSPLVDYPDLDWQKQALVYGVWPDNKPIWGVNEAKDSLTSGRASTCHDDREGCLGLKPLFVDNAEFLNKMFLGTGWR